MRDFFNFDSPLVRALNKLFDVMWLNLLTLLCCLPIVTIGASLTSMHMVLLKLYRDEDTYVARSFFKAFVKNFRQTTLLWFSYLLIGAVLAADLWILYTDAVEMHDAVKIVMTILAVVYLISLFWAFILQSRYINPIKITMKNTLIVGLSHPLQTVAIVFLTIAPFLLLLFIYFGTPIFILYGLAGPGYVQCLMYSRVFDEIEHTDNTKSARKERAAEAETQDAAWTLEETLDGVQNTQQ